jgi:hypothetical protein
MLREERRGSKFKPEAELATRKALAENLNEEETLSVAITFFVLKKEYTLDYFTASFLLATKCAPRPRCLLL